jgi:hypothetical protein
VRRFFRVPDELVDRFAGEQLTGQCWASGNSCQWSVISGQRAMQPTVCKA